MTLSLAGDLLVRRRPPRRDASGQPVFRLQVSRNRWLAANRTINSGYFLLRQEHGSRHVEPRRGSRSSEARASRAAGFGWARCGVKPQSTCHRLPPHAKPSQATSPPGSSSGVGP